MSLNAPEPEAEEGRIIQAALAGDARARGAIAERYTPIVQRFTLHLMGNYPDAADAAQETLVKVLRNLHQYDSRWRFSTWVISIARNTCLDEFRKRRRHRQDELFDVADTQPSPAELAARQTQDVRLHQALQSLSTIYREVLVLYHFEHRSYHEIAQMLDIPIGTVMARIFRARRKLRVVYEGLGGNPEDAR